MGHPERLLLVSAFRALPEFSANHSLPFAAMDAICLIKKNFVDEIGGSPDGIFL